MRPASSSVKASFGPRNGMCCAWMPALRRNRSAARCDVEPMPAEAKLSSPGLALAAAISSATVLIALGRRDHEHGRRLAERDHRREIVEGVVGQALVERERRTERRRVHQQRVAVRRRLADRGDADGSAGARPVLDHDRLVDLLRHLLEHDAADDVVGGAGGERDDRLDVPLGPVLRQRAGSCAGQAA